MPLLQELIRASRRLIGAAAIASLIGGVCSVLLVATINNALSAPDEARRALLIQFAVLALLMVAARILAGVLFSRLGQATVAQLRLYISQKVIDAPYRHIEQTGPARIHSLPTDDANNVATFFVSLPVLIMNAAIVIGCFTYLSTSCGSIGSGQMLSCRRCWALRSTPCAVIARKGFRCMPCRQAGDTFCSSL